MSRNDPQFNIRIPAALKDLVEDAARQSGRSVTSEVITRLEQSFAEAGRDSHAADALATIIERLGEIERQMGLREAAPGFTKPSKRALLRGGKGGKQ